MPTVWDAFIEDYRNELSDWSTRELLKLFWHYCQDGCEAVRKCQQEMQQALKEEYDGC